MAQQHVILQTIHAMKRTMRKHALHDDNDDVRKLKRRVRETSLAYTREIEHAGYKRRIISVNPLHIDDDGDIYSPESSEDEAARGVGLLHDDAFDGVHIEQLLRPLTSPADLPDHPALSLPYKSNALTHMASEALEMLRRERASLWQAKRLLQRFQGDGDWVPSATFETDCDELLLNGEGSVTDQSFVPSLLEQPGLHLEPTAGQLDDASVADMVGDNLSKTVPSAERHAIPDNDAMEGVETLDMAKVQAEVDKARQDGEQELSGEELVNGDAQDAAAGDDAAPKQDDTSEQIPNPAVVDIVEREAASETASNSNGTSTHGMTTRARARSPAERSDRTASPTPSDSVSALAVNPWFVAPASSLSDRDLGLPVNEAEETRKLLLLYVQKQEQIVRSFDSLYTGLQKADRLRQYVYRSCKAEAHLVPDGKGNMVTALSDGEDWYDLADWNIQVRELKDGDLEKGKDEVEDVEEEGRRRPGRGRRVNRM